MPRQATEAKEPTIAVDASALQARATRRYGYQGLLGVALVAVWWPIAWSQTRPLSDYYFFPLWLGFILTLDALVELRTGTSLWRRSHARFVGLFLVSVPFWWIFEWMNGYLQNWHYLTPQPYSRPAYVFLASLAFSTVVPAVLEMSELVASVRIGERLPQIPAWHVTRRGQIAFFLLGWAMLAAVVAFPRYAFPFAWLSVFFIIEPINAAVGQRSISAFVREGNWAAVYNIMLATVLTGFFWEMWNFYSLPKWYYTVPFVDFGHLFEMPILGYTGYIPFGLELFAIYGLVTWLVERKPQRYARVSSKG